MAETIYWYVTCYKEAFILGIGAGICLTKLYMRNGKAV